MYSNGTEDDANKWSDNRHYYGLGLKYADKAATAALIFEALDGKGTGGEKKLGTGLNTYLKTLGLDLIKGDDLTAMDKRTAEFKDRKTAYSVTAGGTYNFGVVTAMGIYQYAWESEMYSQHAFGLSASAPLAGGTAKLGARYLLGKLDGDAKNVAKTLDADTKYRAWNIDAGYTYPFDANAPTSTALPATQMELSSTKMSKTVNSTAGLLALAWSTNSNHLNRLV